MSTELVKKNKVSTKEKYIYRHNKNRKIELTLHLKIKYLKKKVVCKYLDLGETSEMENEG